ncbi:MAG: methionine--tRNA ligase [Saprospiraceae bacterium]|jgi:methionyl-tRNA synthetase|uniref:methionine--tRNA ligase n=1 Tax=Candidatus Brachybacter algidus TaxID=2982024 RepID=UPI001B6E10C2|nr:methionine--tRNA ligase [Candidatus Brachybacter algidus]MBP7306911.1 methionine--tRNA ligase [Saprospiraceae bacterium]MBK6373844.1 methionine--tRNA ligase [Candidatus Brachybacter algidus]MBK6449007.1 methionine--tRNA ligase [Candidatus Brachybacter algidus]MBK8355607.1 methionine--tRNA ligase [Candidatus Brachybacter algidus]MBK8748658.1 methionine--tRNA ligase [Candidatus Brachybacter algidus]
MAVRLPKRYLVTSALPYANGPLHIGHLAGAYLSADVFVRFLRLMKKDVLFVCGSDEHGAAITLRAAKEGISPQEIVDKYHGMFEDTFKKMGISFDIYHRTTSELHHETSQDFFRTLEKKGQFTRQESMQYYDEKAQQFLADRYIKGTCPNCKYEGAYGDQCENCGTSLSPTDLINPKSTLTDETPVLRPTTHWYLPLEKHSEWLSKWLDEGIYKGKQMHDPKEWKNHVLGQCKSWIDGGLQPRAMTRDLDWGVDVPQELEGSLGKKLYVWLDAPIGYISATKQLAADTGKDWKKYWQDKDSAIVHFIGKDNIVFHSIIFPALLHAHGDYIMPDNVPANAFLNLEGQKISTSRNWAVWVHEYLEDLPGKEDVLRYVMIRNMPEQRDSEFTWRNFQEINDNELVGNLANFVNRVMVLTHKFYNGKVPKFEEEQDFAGSHGPLEDSFVEAELMDVFDMLFEMREKIYLYDFRGALQQMMNISTVGNQILQFNEPWKIVETDPHKVKAIMNCCIQIIAALSVAVRPFMPFTSDRMRTMLNLPPIEEKGELLKVLDRLAEGEYLVKPGHLIGQPEHLFSRIPDEVIQAQITKLKENDVTAPAADSKNGKAAPAAIDGSIQYEDFEKVSIVTGKILEAIKVEKTDKLLKLLVDIGTEQRTIVSGIAEHFEPSSLVGKDVLVVKNLAPRKLKGIESKGMLLTAEDADGKLGIVAPPAGWPLGSKVK